MREALCSRKVIRRADVVSTPFTDLDIYKITINYIKNNKVKKIKIDKTNLKIEIMLEQFIVLNSTRTK